MSAEEGNKYYLLRTTHGRKKKFRSAKALADACNLYFIWSVENPYRKPVIVHKTWVETKRKLISKKGKPEEWETTEITHPYMTVYEDVPRPFSLEALCNHLDIHVDTFREYEKLEDYSVITKRVRQIIDNQQIEGATMNIYNANIIARRQGLVDNKDVTTKGDKLPPPVQQEIKVSKEDVKEIAKALLNAI